MNEILDEYLQKGKKKNNFSRLSFVFSLITLFLIIFLFNQIPSTISANREFPVIPVWIIIVTHISCYSGLFFSIMSFVKKEKLKYLRIAGAVLNILLFAIIIGSIIIAKVI